MISRATVTKQLKGWHTRAAALATGCELKLDAEDVDMCDLRQNKALGTSRGFDARVLLIFG